MAKECGIVSKGAAYESTLAISAATKANHGRLRAKRYERLMKANGIHPNGGSSMTPSIAPSPTAKTVSKAAMAKAAATKKRKIEGTPSLLTKHDEEEDEPVKPKLEPFLHLVAHSAVKAEPLFSSSIPFPGANFSTADGLTPAMERTSPQQQLESATSVFEEFCVPEMFAQHGFEEAHLKSEQLPPLPPSSPPLSPLQPRYVPLPSPGMVGRLKQSSSPDSRRESGRGPLHSIVIAD